MQCQRCQRNISENEIYVYQGETLCDDCHIDAMPTPNPCDPLATRLATRAQENLGLGGADRLTPLQKAIYEYIRNNDKAIASELITSFSITQRDLDRVVATLRHCELVKGKKEGETVYLVPF